MKRIIYTLAVGKPKFAEFALGLGRSLKLIGDSTPRVVVTDQLNHPWETCFDQVLPPEGPPEWVYLNKLSGLDRTDADQVLFIDADCLVFRRLDPIFEHCQGRGLSVQGHLVTDGNWYGDVKQHLQRHQVTGLPKFNGGMVYYERTEPCMEVIKTCRLLGDRAAESGIEWKKPGIPDEPYLSLAMAKCGADRPGYCHIISELADFQGAGANIIGKLRLDILENRCQFINWDARLVEPYIFHCWRYANYGIYWKQLDSLRKLEEYRTKHKYGYLSHFQKVERYLNKRYLRYIRRKL